MDKSVFEVLSKVNVNEYIEQKNGLSFLSWPRAWGEVKKRYPSADYDIEQFGENKAPYQDLGEAGIMCYTKVTIEQETKRMWLPVMDASNNSMRFEPYTYTMISKGKEIKKYVTAATMCDINRTLMRCLTKNLAMFGLGLYIYAGEDLPECEDFSEQFVCEECGAVIKPYGNLSAKVVAETRKKRTRIFQ